MTNSPLYAGLYAAVAMLAGCTSASTPLAGGLTAPVQIANVQRSGDDSWMLPEAQHDDLIYADSQSGSDTYVFAYPGGKLVGTIKHGPDMQGGLCADGHGDVYVTGVDRTGLGLIDEYAHGGKKPINAFQENQLWPDGCAVDPLTGNLAVSSLNWASDPSGVEIYEAAQGAPVLYSEPAIVNYYFCGYDNAGNLFVNGSGSGNLMHFAELPKGATAFTDIAVDKNIPYTSMGQVQWDGSALTVEDGAARAIYSLRISGSTATIAGTTKLQRFVSGQWLSWIAGDIVFAPISSSPYAIGAWAYPSGGSPLATIAVPGRVLSVAFSPAQRR